MKYDKFNFLLLLDGSKTRFASRSLINFVWLAAWKKVGTSYCINVAKSNASGVYY